MKFLILFLFIPVLIFGEFTSSQVGEGKIVNSLTNVKLPEYLGAHNPSIIETKKGLLLTFRWSPNPLQPWISYIGIVYLNSDLQPISKPQLLNTREGNPTIPSQSEDARIFYFRDELYILYNDNPNFTNPAIWNRRDMYLAKLKESNGQFIVSNTTKLYHQQQYAFEKWQKNWVPFVWQDALLFSYWIIPHEVLYPDLITGECMPFVTTSPSTPLQWEWGNVRGGTPALLLNGEYLAFFHSSIITTSPSSKGKSLCHYFLGAYTFSNEPPFEITKYTSSPIVADGFYTYSKFVKRVIFPGGFVVKDTYILLAYGKDDNEVWIAKIDRKILQEKLVPIE